MQGRLLTIRRLAAILESHFDCTVELFPAGAIGSEEDGTDSPPLYGIRRTLLGRKHPLLSTIVVDHEDLPIRLHNLRSFLARLELTLDDVLQYLD